MLFQIILFTTFLIPTCYSQDDDELDITKIVITEQDMTEISRYINSTNYKYRLEIELNGMDKVVYDYCVIANNEKWKTVPFDKCIRMMLRLSAEYLSLSTNLNSLLDETISRCSVLFCETEYGTVTTEIKFESQGAKVVYYND